MSKELYEEALADVKKLKEVAEDNAKRALLEAVTPRIRDLIENQLMGGDVASPDEDLLFDDTDEDSLPVGASTGIGDSDAAADAISMPDEEGKVTLDLSSLKVPGTEEYEISAPVAESLGVIRGETKSREAVFEARLKQLSRKIEAATTASRIVKESAGYDDTLRSIVSEVEDTYSYMQDYLSESSKIKSYSSTLNQHFTTLKQLMEQKMKRNRLSEADITLKLTGMPDEVDLDSIGVDLITGEEGGEEDLEGGDEELDLDSEEGEGGDEGEEGGDEELDLDLDSEEGDEEDSEEATQAESRRLSDNVIVEIDEGMLRREISRMRALREADETKPQSWGHGPGSVSDDFEDDDLGDPFVDVDLTTEGYAEADDKSSMGEMDELDQLDQAKDEPEMGGNQDEQSNKQSRQPGATTESLRRRLAQEARIQLEAKQKAQQAKKQQGKKQQEAQQKQKEAQQKMKEAQQKQKQGKKQEAQQKKQEAQKKHQEAQQKKQQGKKMQEAYNFYARKFNESVARAGKLKGMLAEAVRSDAAQNGASVRSAEETSNLRARLAETNLFNAKLLFTNKLLQNESLTKRQKADVIERLDEARNEREVKLVYESLVKALQGSPAKLTESAHVGVLGSSSRPVRPAATTGTLNEGFEADRWARLAGIVK